MIYHTFIWEHTSGFGMFIILQYWATYTLNEQHTYTMKRQMC